MGYTRYWTRKDVPITASQWKAFTDDVKKIVAKHRKILSFEYDQPRRAPIVSAEQVRFNGRGDDGHETLVIDRAFEVQDWRGRSKGSFFFCKTARKPYDEVVAAVLSCLRQHVGHAFEISSDGGNNPDDAEDGLPPYELLVEKYKLGGES